MKIEINDQELENVNGGYYHIWNDDSINFDTIPGKEWYLKPGARYQAMAIMDGLAGQFQTMAQYDQACYEAIRDAGLLAE